MSGPVCFYFDVKSTVVVSMDACGKLIYLSPLGYIPLRKAGKFKRSYYFRKGNSMICKSHIGYQVKLLYVQHIFIKFSVVLLKAKVLIYEFKCSP